MKTQLVHFSKTVQFFRMETISKDSANQMNLRIINLETRKFLYLVISVVTLLNFTVPHFGVFLFFLKRKENDCRDVFLFLKKSVLYVFFFHINFSVVWKG